MNVVIHGPHVKYRRNGSGTVWCYACLVEQDKPSSVDLSLSSGCFRPHGGWCACFRDAVHWRKGSSVGTRRTWTRAENTGLDQ